MAIIYSYPHSTSILADDLVVGTTTVTVGGKRRNQTKNFRLADISTFVIDNITLTTAGTSGPATFIGNTLNIPNYSGGGGGGTINAGTGISVSYIGDDATIINTDLGSSQNIFKNIAVPSQVTVVADSNNDTLTLLAGTGISIITNPFADAISISVSQTGLSYATTISATGTVTHNLNTRDVNVQLYDTVTYKTISEDVTRTTTNTITVTFASPPTNPVRVLVTRVG